MASPDPIRQEIVAGARTLVIKVGTGALTRGDGRLDEKRVRALTHEIAAIVHGGRRVALVSSGAIGTGLGILGLAERPTALRQLQGAAAVGQAHLVATYDRMLRRHRLRGAQLLLTAEDFGNRDRYLNVRNTLHALFEWGAIPIINENDTVSVEELRFGDNDTLAAHVTNLLRAPLLILLSNVDGLLTHLPRAGEAPSVVPVVAHIDGRVEGLAAPQRSKFGSGGMQSKLAAAAICSAAGESVILANGTTPGILRRILAAEPVGTLFLPQGKGLPSWKRWIGYSVPPRGVLRVDEGARAALERRGGSLLPIGVVAIEGDFAAGEIVAIGGRDGDEFARGIVNYGRHDLARIRGLRSANIAEVLGESRHEEVVHRDNLALLRGARRGG